MREHKGSGPTSTDLGGSSSYLDGSAGFLFHERDSGLTPKTDVE